MTTDHDDDFEPHHSSSPTDHVLHELQLYGYRPFQDEPDPRPLPEGDIIAGSISDIFDALVVALAEGCLRAIAWQQCEQPWWSLPPAHRALRQIRNKRGARDTPIRPLEIAPICALSGGGSRRVKSAGPQWRPNFSAPTDIQNV